MNVDTPERSDAGAPYEISNCPACSGIGVQLGQEHAIYSRDTVRRNRQSARF